MPHFRIVDEFPSEAAANDVTGFHDVASIGNGQCQIDVLFSQKAAPPAKGLTDWGFSTDIHPLPRAFSL